MYEAKKKILIYKSSIEQQILLLKEQKFVQVIQDNSEPFY